MPKVFTADLATVVEVPNVTTATSDPGATTDAAHGYLRGDLIVNTSGGGKVWVCQDNTTGAAVWLPVQPPGTETITGGTIDGAVIGGNAATAGTFTNLTATGTLASSLSGDVALGSYDGHGGHSRPSRRYGWGLDRQRDDRRHHHGAGFVHQRHGERHVGFERHAQRYRCRADVAG